MRLYFGILVLFAGVALTQAAETIPPKPDRYFNDYAGVVSAEAAQRFNEQLAQFERETSNQIIVAIWRTMPSQSSIEDFTQRTFQAWQVGQKGRNNGAVFFVFVDDHRMRIQTGYGLEGALPDITCNEIIRDAVAPRFRAKDFEGGFAAGIDLIFKAIRGEYKGTGKTVRESGTSQNSSTAGLLVFFFVLIMILLAMRASRRRTVVAAGSDQGRQIRGGRDGQRRRAGDVRRGPARGESLFSAARDRSREHARRRTLGARSRRHGQERRSLCGFLYIFLRRLAEAEPDPTRPRELERVLEVAG